MDNSELQLFSPDTESLVMPSISDEVLRKQKELQSEDISEAISGSVIKTLILPEDLEIPPFNYIFDFTQIETISIFQKNALKALVTKDGDTPLYLYNKKGMLLFGHGRKQDLERLLPSFRQFIFGEELRIYKDVAPNKEVTEVSDVKDITKLRLNI